MYSLSSIYTCNLIFILFALFSNNVFVLGEFVDKYSGIPNFSLVDESDLTRILKSEIFVHKDG